MLQKLQTIASSKVVHALPFFLTSWLFLLFIIAWFSGTSDLPLPSYGPDFSLDFWGVFGEIGIIYGKIPNENSPDPLLLTYIEVLIARTP